SSGTSGYWRPGRTAFPSSAGRRESAAGRKRTLAIFPTRGKIKRNDVPDALEHGRRSEEHTSELQSRFDLVCRLLLEKKKAEGQSREHANRSKSVFSLIQRNCWLLWGFEQFTWR